MKPDIVVAVGSQNPPKLCAVQEVFCQLLGQPVQVIGMNAESGVPEQPWDGDTATGALNRCHRARVSYPDADYYVGIEAGIYNDLLPGELTCIEVAYVGRKGEDVMTGGMTGGFAVPPNIRAPLAFDGITMGEAADKEYGTSDLGMKEGLVGIVTGNRVRRQGYIALSVLFALATHLQRYPSE